MRIFVKICGLSTSRAIAAAISAGADALGFVFAESPRQVTPTRARELCSEVSPVIVRVAVMRHPAAAHWRAVAEEFQPDWLQTEAGDYSGLDVPPHVGRLPVYRDVQALAVDAVPSGQMVLFEAAASGQGERADWQRAAALAPGRQLVLAGGLTPENVGEAIATVRPWGVDVSSGVESRRGVKDVGLITAFIDAVRAAELQHAI
ncbi:MAG: phosphoribosylanthranilate isomerase [Gammaproteobacteria bacterium]|nr:phosphoribosylanthranilate isomerase [Gammaproteobacteria bacterium]MDH5276073.1 phosphoribosylanthranilate isomerase [Gammaproteobacteria bacterium]